jgi:phage terminase Nu1 subunit (DNA packaging protein)
VNTCTRRELAGILKVHPITITKWERDGLPIATRGRKGKPSLYNPTKVQAWLQAREDAVKAGSPGFAENRGRKELALALESEQRVAIKAGRLIEAAGIESRVAEVFARCKTKLLGLPRKAKAALPHLTQADVLKLDDLVREVAEELAGPLPRTDVDESAA